MASLKNAEKAARRIHRERVQPLHRRHFGELEKKKDYKQRAQDYQAKRKKLKVLRQKATERNPDEFYFHMAKSRTTDGRHEEKDDECSVEQQRLLDAQDLRYVQFKALLEQKKVERLKSSLHFLSDGVPKNTHTIFVDSKTEARRFDPAQHLDTHPALLNRTYNRPRLDALQQPVFMEEADSHRTISKERKKRYKELMSRMEREEELKIVAAKLNARKLVSESGPEKPERILKGNSKRAPVYKWKFERKR